MFDQILSSYPPLPDGRGSHIEDLLKGAPSLPSSIHKSNRTGPYVTGQGSAFGNSEPDIILHDELVAISLFISYFFSVVRTFSNAITLCQSPCLANKWHFGLFPSTAVSMLKVDVFCKTEKIAGYEKGKNTLPGYFIGSPHHKEEQSW